MTQEAALTDRKALTLAVVKKMMAAAEAEAVKININVAIAVVDDGGHLLAFQKMDGAPPVTIEIAIGKARTAANFRSPSADAESMMGDYIGMLNAPDIMPLRGGVPVTVDGVVIGAVGASGATSQQDEQAAIAGANAAQ